MFKALLSLQREKGTPEPLRSIAFLALAPIYQYVVGGADEGQSPPVGGWDKWLEGITAESDSDMGYYDICGGADAVSAVKLFCAGGTALRKNPTQAFANTLKAAQAGYVPAAEVVGMMYATGKGVQQDYTEAGKWFLTAAEGGDLRAPVHYAGNIRDGESPLRRNTELAARWAKFTAEHPAFAPPQRRPRATPAATPPAPVAR